MNTELDKEHKLFDSTCSILANMSNPDVTIGRVIERLGKEMEKVGIKFFYSSTEKPTGTVLANVQEWIISRGDGGGKGGRIYLYGPDRKCRAKFYESRKKEAIMFFSEIKKIWREELGGNMKFYKIIGAKNESKDDCEGLTINAAKKKFPNTNNFVIGAYYTNHPKDKKALTPIDSYFTTLMSNINLECIELFRKMGAKTVTIERFSNKEGGNTTGGKINVTNDVIIDAEFGLMISKRLQKEEKIVVEFEGCNTDFSPNILENSIWFRKDPEMDYILKARMSKKNKIKTFKVETNALEDLHLDINAAVGVLGIAKAKLENDYKNAKNTRRVISVEFP